MQRGILTVTKQELLEIVQHIDLNRYEGSPFKAKIEAGLNTNVMEGGMDNANEISLEVSEEEVEIMLDAIVIPEQGESVEIKNARNKLQQKIVSFR